MTSSPSSRVTDLRPSCRCAKGETKKLSGCCIRVPLKKLTSENHVLYSRTISKFCLSLVPRSGLLLIDYHSYSQHCHDHQYSSYSYYFFFCRHCSCYYFWTINTTTTVPINTITITSTRVLLNDSNKESPKRNPSLTLLISDLPLSLSPARQGV